jgi:hypothetical protein
VNLESLGDIGELVGGLALIASLIYLAVQIRQNTASVRLQVEQAIRRDQFDLRRPFIENPDLADLLVRAIADFDSLSPAERFRANMTSANAIEHLQRIFLLREEGLVHWESQEAVLRSYLALEPVRRWWSSGREILQPEFVEYVERHIQPTLASASPPHWQP